MINQTRKSCCIKRKRDDSSNNDMDIQRRKKKKKVNDEEESININNKPLNDKEKYEIIMKNYGYNSIILIKALYLYWIENYKEFLLMFKNNDSFKRLSEERGSIVLLLSYEKFLEEIELIKLENKNILFVMGKKSERTIHTLINNLFEKIQNNESIGEYFYLCRGKCHQKIGNIEKALSVLNEGIKFTKNMLLVKFYGSVGNCLYDIKGFVGSIEFFDKAIEIDPNNTMRFTSISVYVFQRCIK